MDPIPPSAGAALGLVLLVAGAISRGSSGRGPWGAALACLSAVAAVALAGWLSGVQLTWPPAAFRGWALLALCASVPLGWFASRGRRQAFASSAPLGVALVCLFLYPTESLHDRYWGGQVALHVGGLGLVAMASVLIRWGQAGRARVAEGMLAFALVALASAPTLGLTGTGVSAALAGALAGASGLFGLAMVARPSWRSSMWSVGIAAGTTQAVGLLGALATGALYAETPLWSAAVLALAPALTLLPGPGPRWAFIRLALVALCAAWPAIAAYLDQPASNPYG